MLHFTAAILGGTMLTQISTITSLAATGFVTAVGYNFLVDPLVIVELVAACLTAAYIYRLVCCPGFSASTLNSRFSTVLDSSLFNVGSALTLPKRSLRYQDGIWWR